MIVARREVPGLEFGHLVPCPEGALWLSLGFQPQEPFVGITSCGDARLGRQ
jgi:hypothetical protein